jgi:nitrate reductase NapAB chaperone NapD
MISGLVIHLDRDQQQAQTATIELRLCSGLELGHCVGGRIPAVVEATDGHAVGELTAWVRGLAGVTHVDVAYVHLED